ncbi:sensor histidine kinase [Rhodocaloribacter sp.]
MGDTQFPSRNRLDAAASEANAASPARVRRVKMGLAMKMGLIVGGAAAALRLALGLAFGLGRPGLALVFGAAVGAVAYGVARRMLAARLAPAAATLERIRHHRFDDLAAPPRPDGDELDRLLLEVYRTGQALEKDLSAFKKVENYRREFLGNVSHELKTPIFSIRGFAETLLEGALDDAAVNRSFVEKILRNADRLSNLAADLAEISRIETGELKMSHEPFDLRRVVRDVVDLLEPIAEEQGITLRHRMPEALPPVMGDGSRIRQVLINLAENGIKYNDPGGSVEIVARPLASGEVKVSVVDNGIGLAPEHLPRLTERFYRVDKSRSRAQGGTGLGLAIVKHILGAHDRTLMVESSPGRGSTFGFTLPTAPADAS